MTDLKYKFQYNRANKPTCWGDFTTRQRQRQMRLAKRKEKNNKEREVHHIDKREQNKGRDGHGPSKVIRLRITGQFTQTQHLAGINTLVLVFEMFKCAAD